jgi:hypothetical protein
MTQEFRQSSSMYPKKTKKPKRQKAAARLEAKNWQKHGWHNDFHAARSEDEINYDELCEDDVEYEYLLQEEYASCWIYPVNLMMEDGHLCSWNGELESESPDRALDFGPLLDHALRKRSEQLQEDLERHGWSFIENSPISTPGTVLSDFEDFEVI